MATVQVRETYIVRYGIQEDGSVWNKEKLRAITPNLQGKAVKLPDGSLAIVLKMWWDESGLRAQVIPRSELEKFAKQLKSPIILPGSSDN